MNAKELMIGDWVTFKDCANDEIVPVRLFGIHNDEECCALAPDHLTDDGYGLDLLEIKNLAGIHITPEILEKNGFKIDKNETYCKRYFFASNLGKVPQTVVEFSFYGEGVSADTLFKCWTKPKSCDGENSIHICDLKSVHELQHALRLCGIEKEIEL